MILYRPTGLRELQLAARSGWRAWPPRLPEQPIFRSHEELWDPAEELDELNRHIVGEIRVIESFAGLGFQGSLDPVTKRPVDFEVDP
jgi:thioesterase domain-containing protein